MVSNGEWLYDVRGNFFFILRILRRIAPATSVGQKSLVGESDLIYRTVLRASAHTADDDPAIRGASIPQKRPSGEDGVKREISLSFFAMAHPALKAAAERRAALSE